jgi:hypothetical protein
MVGVIIGGGGWFVGEEEKKKTHTDGEQTTKKWEVDERSKLAEGSQKSGR